MPKKIKLKLGNLEVNSFTTDVAKNSKGGTRTDHTLWDCTIDGNTMFASCKNYTMTCQSGPVWCQSAVGGMCD